MLESRPLAEKRQMSATATPVAGRCKATGFPASEQELLAVEKAPRAATFRSTSALGRETPAVEGSTTTMSLDVAEGAALVREMISSDGLRAATMRETLLDVRLAKPDCDGSSSLMATMVKASGDGAEPGAV